MHGEPFGGPVVLAGIAQPCLSFRGGACLQQALCHRLHLVGQRSKETHLS